MRRALFLTILSAPLLIGVPTFSAAPASAQAIPVINPNFGDAAIRRINSDGFRRCNALGNRGFTAIVTGINEGGSGPGATGFRVHTCFETRAGCENFTQNIGRWVGTINRLRSRGCFARG